MDMELLRLLLTTTGPMGLLAYGMFRHHTHAMQANTERIAGFAKDYAELVKDRMAERDHLINVVQQNSAVISALIERLGRARVRIDDLKHSHHKHDGEDT